MNDIKKQIIKDLGYFQYKMTAREVFLDAVEQIALNTATHFDEYKSKERVERFNEITKKYDEQDRPVFLNINKNIMDMLSGMIDAFGDYLGDLYMEICGGTKESGQFFTPYSVSKLIAGITFDEGMLEKDMVTINEPTCGSGGMILAALEEMTVRKFNYAEHALIVANDIDRNCVNMCYVQLSYAGAPAVVKHQDTLTQKTFDAFVTPAFALNQEKFLSIYKSLSAGSEM